MGYFQPGGAGTTVYIYDDNDAGGGHVAGQPHTAAELNAAFPLAFAEMQDAAGNRTTAGRVFLVVDNIVVGGGPAPYNGTNTTTWTETVSLFFFTMNNRSISIRDHSTAFIHINWGNKIGTGDRTTGFRGVSYFQAANIIQFRQNLRLYGCRFECSSGSMIVSDAQLSNTIEMANCQMHVPTNGAATLGTSGVGVSVYNTDVTTDRSGATMFVQANMLNGSNVNMGSTGALTYFSQSNITLAKHRGLVFCSTPTFADFRHITATGQYYIGITWSPSPNQVDLGVSGIDPEGSAGSRTIVKARFRVHDLNGDAVSGIPCFLSSTGRDYASVTGYDVFSDYVLTDGEGNLSWSEVNSNTPNGLCARSYGTDGAGNEIASDRVFTMIVNHTGSPSYNPNYTTETYYFSLPGQDMNADAVLSGAGDYYPSQAIPFLVFSKTALQPWVECEAP